MRYGGKRLDFFILLVRYSVKALERFSLFHFLRRIFDLVNFATYFYM